MNIARKSTTKLPQSWQQPQTGQSKQDDGGSGLNYARKTVAKVPNILHPEQSEPKEDEGDSGVASADSTDSFQDALLNLKALSGNCDIVESDRCEVLQTACTAEEMGDVDKNGAASSSVEHGNEQDILDQIDNIVSDKKDVDQTDEDVSDGKSKEVLYSVSQKSPSSVKDECGSEQDDEISLVQLCDSRESSKEQPKGPFPQKANADLKNKNMSVTSTKNPLRIGEKVRSTVHSIMSKLVQNNPDVNSLLSKAKTEESTETGNSNSASPLPVRHDKGNLFDNFDITDKECKSHFTADKNSVSSQLSTSGKADESSKEDVGLENGEESMDEVTDSSVEKVKRVASPEQSSQSPDRCANGNPALQTPQHDSLETNDEKSLAVGDLQAKEDVECKHESVESADSSTHAVVSDGSSPVRKNKRLPEGESECNIGEQAPSNAAEPSCLSDTKLSECESVTKDAVTTETAESALHDKVVERSMDCESDVLKPNDKTVDGDRKRTLENGVHEMDDSESRPPKRSRLDEVIGKLEERVPFPPQVPENECIDDESIPGDTDSTEKQSEEICGSTSDEEEDKTSADSKLNTVKLTRQELEALVIATSKAAIERYQSTEILALNRRIEELKESQEEWRQKAKELERQVLDLTVLQQRLEKRKAHTAALKSITTRSIGVWVTEDKLKVGTPQKHPGNKTPPATPPAAGQPALLWASGNRSLPSTSAPSSVSQSAPSRNTSVAHLLSQTARMPTVASCAAATRPATAKVTSTAPMMPVSVSAQHIGSSPVTRGANPSSVVPSTSLVLVTSAHAVPASQKSAAPAGSSQVKFIDLTMEDDAGAPKQPGKQGVGPGSGRTMVPQQMVRQIPPMSQAVPGAASSTILLSSPAGTQIVNAGSLTQPGMLQVVTIANAQSLRPGSILTVMPGQPGSFVQQAAAPTTLTSSARGSAPVLMTQQLPGVFMRPPPAIIGGGANVRPPAVASSGAAKTIPAATNTRMPVAVTSVPPHAAVLSGSLQQDTVSQAAASSASKKNSHPAPLPDDICPKGLPAKLKPPPPSPGLKISRVKQGIVLSWNMPIPADCVEIASYQLFAYQETSAAPQTSLWKKVGDVKALPLPMACTLTQFQDGNKYHFAVRAIDVHGRSGPFSEPSYIFLTKAA